MGESPEELETPRAFWIDRVLDPRPMPDQPFAANQSPGQVLPLVPQPVRVAVDGTMARLAAKRFDPDPIVSLRDSRITSIVSSAYKRHGKIIELCLATALEAAGFRTWTEPRFRISAAADRLADDDHSLDAMLPYGEVARVIQVDLVVVQIGDHLGAYECKRGFGHHDAGKQRSMLRDLRCLHMLLRSYGSRVLGVDVPRVDARLISYYGRRSLPPRWSLTGPELDEHFGVKVVAQIEAGNRYFRERLGELLEAL